MSGGHDHGESCHCKECEDKHVDAERTSIEEAGGVAVGLTGHIHGYNADVTARFSNAMLTTGKWVEKEAGSLLGHIKAAIYTSEGRGFTLNLTSVDGGVEQHGTLPPQEMVEFSFMSAVLDVDAHGLEHVMKDALEDSGIDYHLADEHCDHD
ncbi:MAG: hydrogenase nickel incorporation protein HypA, partial [Candidatus Methanoplasma sp.]|nr:hydrogenase nickel incorporation protein HypA [Candidatus Methanoplasma sp.]